jgi:hypothetical protein
MQSVPNAIIVSPSSSQCGSCGGPCNPNEPAHITRLGYDPGEGCGEPFLYITTFYAGSEAITAAMRPDLPFLGLDERPGERLHALLLMGWHLDQIARAEAKSGEPMFMGVPDRWFDDLTFRCTTGHVSKTILKTDRGDECLACRAPVRITFPEDAETDPPTPIGATT